MPIVGNIPDTLTQYPNSRFAITALSNRERRYSVNGEMLMDKVSGEIFIRRTDGRIVSFHQTHKNIYDVMLELRLLLVSNTDTKYPTDDSAYLVIQNYDLMTFTAEDQPSLNVLTNTSIDLSSEGYECNAYLSSSSNAIFIRIDPRDCDKALINYLTYEYDKFFSSYSGSDNTLNTEAAKMSDTLYANNNAEITISVDGTEYTRYATVGDLSLIDLDGITGDSIIITSIAFPKLYYMYNNLSIFSEDIQETVNNLIYEDNQLLVNTMTVESYTDDTTEINTGDETNLIQILGSGYAVDYMAKMQNLMNQPDTTVSPDRPSDLDWTTNTLWAETIREIDDTSITETEHETDVDAMESTIGTILMS